MITPRHSLTRAAPGTSGGYEPPRATSCRNRPGGGHVRPEIAAESIMAHWRRACAGDRPHNGSTPGAFDAPPAAAAAALGVTQRSGDCNDASRAER